MHIKNIQITQFKNHTNYHIEFVEGVNCILGKNGIGKSNLLDAIYYICLTKSAFQSSDLLNIQKKSDFFSIIASLKKAEKSHRIQCSLKRGEKKIFKLDKKPYEKMSEHIGEFPCVLIAPDDMDIIKGGSENRRKFVDQLLCQLDKQYLNALMQYNQVLKQRNSLLKQALESGRFNESLFEVYNEQMQMPANYVHQKRKSFIGDFALLTEELYSQISSGNEKVELLYESEMNENDLHILQKQNFYKDKKSARSNNGIHKDDFIFNINDEPIRKFGSQGQQKSFLLALKLAQFQSIKLDKSFNPILLLDDIFDKLDDIRIQKLIELISSKEFGQVFITDARPERSQELLHQIIDNVKYIELKPNA